MELREFFAQQRGRIALAFSGGTDSAYLLHAAVSAGADVRPYFVRSPFQPAFELKDARRLADELGVTLTVIETQAPEKALENGAERCYFCKKALFTALLGRAKADGCTVVIDGTNASDDGADRPGMRALGELGVLSPLRLCGITKERVRALSAEAGLFTARKPSYACLATRVPTGERITAQALEAVEGGEEKLREMGFSDFRIRLFCGAARVQLRAEQMAQAVGQREEICRALSPWFETVLLDLKER